MGRRGSDNDGMYNNSKMKHIIYILLLCLMPAAAMAQTAEEQKAIQYISRGAAAMTSMQADFTQTKHLKMLGDKMVSHGKMYYRQTDKLRWEYTSPYTYTFIINGQKVMVKKGARKDVTDVNGNRLFREIARVMMNSVVGKCITDSKTFKVSMETSAQAYTATLIPQRKDMRQMFSRIVLVFDRKTATVSKVTMHERNGDYTDIVLRNVKTGINIDNSLFAL